MKTQNLQTSKITTGTRIEANKMVMVVTGETKTHFLGYYEYKGKIVIAGECALDKEKITNPHYCHRLKILN